MITVREAHALVSSYAEALRQRRCANLQVFCSQKTAAATEPASEWIGLDVFADRDMPPYDRVVMDGVAIRFEDFAAGLRSFAIEGIQAAGSAPLHLVGRGTCVEVMTGAVKPEGCDTVIRYEDLNLENNQAVLRPEVFVSKGQNIHFQGCDHKKGDLLIAAGTLITPPYWAVLATVGCAEFPVFNGPHISILSTGDELVPIAAVPQGHQIRASNGCAIHAACHEFGYSNTQVALVGDSKPQLRKALSNALEKSDVLVLTGAVSAGKFDLVPEVLQEAGVKEVFHKVAQRPGKPLWFGVSGAGQLVFGLPGNPVSALVSFYRYVLPALGKVRSRVPIESLESCETVRYAKLRNSFVARGSDALTFFLPAKLEYDCDGSCFVRTQQISSSGNLTALLESDGFVEFSSDVSEYLQNEPVRFFSWRLT